MRQTALVLAFLAYLLPLAWQIALRPEPGEPVHGMFWFVTTAASLVFALVLSGVATALIVAARRDVSQPVLGASALTRVELALVAALAVVVTLLFVALFVSRAAA